MQCKGSGLIRRWFVRFGPQPVQRRSVRQLEVPRLGVKGLVSLAIFFFVYVHVGQWSSA
jgi:hypothetical protein